MRITVISMLVTAGLIATLAGAPPCQSAQLAEKTVQAFEQYVRSREAAQALSTGNRFLQVDHLPEQSRAKAYSDLKQRQIVVENVSGRNSDDGIPVPGGLIHDWIGTAFIEHASIPQVLELLQDYDHDQVYYQPDVLESKLLNRSGDEFQVFLRIKEVHVVTVVFDTEYDVRYSMPDATHATSRSYSTRIAEVENPGTKQEQEKPLGNDHGFLWRLYTYWRFYEADGGAYIQCEAISLTREIPTGFGWIVRPFIEDIPRESLRFTLEATRTALVKRFSVFQIR